MMRHFRKVLGFVLIVLGIFLILSVVFSNGNINKHEAEIKTQLVENIQSNSKNLLQNSSYSEEIPFSHDMVDLIDASDFKYELKREMVKNFIFGLFIIFLGLFFFFGKLLYKKQKR